MKERADRMTNARTTTTAAAFLRLSICLAVAAPFFAFHPRLAAATVSWVGGSGDWNTAANWSGGAVPAPTNDVVIDRPGLLTITHTSGTHTVRSIQCLEDFVLSGGTLSCTSAVTLMAGDFRMSNGAVLSVSGPMTFFSTPNATNIDDGGLRVTGGASASLPGLRNYRTTGNFTSWQVSGPGSVLSLPGLTNLAGPVSVYCLTIQAMAGGLISLSNVATISGGHLCVLADGAGSVIDAPALAEHLDPGDFSFLALEARYGGAIRVPQLVDGKGAYLTLRPGGSITTTQFKRLFGVTLENVSLALPGVTNFDNGSVSVSGGAVLSMPGVRSYSRDGPFGVTWQASGSGSVLHLPGLTNLSGPVSVYCLGIQAMAGGFVNLSNVVTVSAGHLCLLAEGAGSAIDLSNLSRHLAPEDYGFLALEARSGGIIRTPQLVDGGGIAITLKPGGSISAAQLQRVFSVTLESVSLSLPGVTNIDNGSLSVSGGAVLSLPGVRSYVREGPFGVTWQADGAGSFLDLPGLTNVAGPVSVYCLNIQARGGGQVSLSNVVTISGGHLCVLADGAASGVDLSSLIQFSNPDSFGGLDMEAGNGGIICVPRLVDGRKVSLTLRPSGFISTAQFKRMGHITLYSVSLAMPGVTNIDGAILTVTGGAVLSLPGLHDYRAGTSYSWQATGAGSVIDLSGLTNMSGNVGIGCLTIEALSGGFVSLGNVAVIPTGRVCVTADGANSLVDLSRLLQHPGTNSFSTVARNGGIIDLSGMVSSIPPAPVLVSPPNGSGNATLAVALNWLAASNVIAFEYELLQGGGLIVQGSGPPGIAVPLPAHGIYQWRIRGKTAHRYSPWSQLWSFDTLPGVGVPALLAPADQAMQVPVVASLGWAAVGGTAGYDYELYRGGVLDRFASVRGAETAIVRLMPATTYSWRVRAKSLYRQGDWSSLRIFRTVSSDPSSLTLSPAWMPSPGSGTIRLNWPAIPGNTYWLQYKHRLEDPAWTELYPLIPSGGQLSADAFVGTNDTAFFRVAQRDGLHLLPASADQDRDRMDDAWELANGLNPAASSDADADPDRDGLSNLDEFELGSNPGVADNAGSLPGQFAVASGGAATYEIPIATPQGTAGIVPKLAVTYNSRSGNGLMGMGWNFSGLSAITRCAPTLAEDGARAAVEFDADDRFCLDGQRLIVAGGTYGRDGAEYRTEIDTFTKVVSYGTNGTGPAYFKAWSKGGQMLEYGVAEDARVEAQGKTTIMVWLLNKITDTSGNYIRFYYTKTPDSGEYMPARIEYTGNEAAGVPPYAAVLFNYESRPDVAISYQAGSVVRGNYRLKNIETYAEGSLVHRYSFAYEQGLATGRSRLNSVTLSDAEGRSLPPTRCAAWTDSASRGVFTIRPPFLPASYDVSTNNFLYETADHNGDGTADLVHFAGPRGVRVWVSKRDGTFDIKPSFPENGYAVDANGYKFLSGDFDGDTKADLIHIIDSTRVRVWLSRGDGTFDIKPDFLPGGYNVAANDYNFRSGDFNGDGRTDLMHLAGPAEVRVWFSNGDGTFFVTDSWNPGDSLSANGYRVFVMDANGDGRSDALHFVNNRFLKAWLSEGDGTFRVTSRFPAQDTYDVGANGYSYSSGDFNGDGKTDLIHFVDENTVRVWLNKGDGTFDIRGELKPSGYTVAHNPFDFSRTSGSFVLRAISQLIGGSQPASPPVFCPIHSFRLGDFNADGKTDFIDVTGPNQMTVWTSKGDGTFIIEPSFSQTNYATAGPFASALLVGNFVSDAKTDLIQLIADNSAHVWQAEGPLPDLLTAVVDGYGHTNRVIYKPLTETNVYQKDVGTAYPQFDMQGPLYVVTEHWTGDGIGGEAVNRYTYGGAKTDVTNGFLGFRWQKTVEERTGVQHYTQSRQDYPHIGSLSFSETRLSNNTLIARSTNSYGVISSFSNKVMFPFVAHSVVETFELDGGFVTRVTTTNSFDAFGNPTVVDVETDDGFRKFTQTTYTNDTNRWILGKLTRAEVTAFAPGQPVQTRVSSFEYNPADGLISRETVEPDSPLIQITDYARDTFGNVTVTTMSGPGVAPRTQRATFDAAGRFPVAVENALGHRETRTYDPRFGTMTEQTGPNNLTTRWTFDGFGRKRREIRPDGVTTRVLYGLPDSHAPPLARHRVLTKTTGSAPSAAYLDELGRELRTFTLGFDGRPIYDDTEYNAQGWVARASRSYFAGDPVYWTTLTHDAIGRKLVETNPDNSQAKMEYHGLTTIAFNELNQRRTTVRNSQNWLVSATDDAGGTVTHSYDAFSNLIRTVDPVGNVTAMSYDARGRKTAMDDPDTGHSEIRYNAFSEVVWRMDARNQTFSTQYDLLGRVTQETIPEGPIIYRYDTATNGIGKLALAVSYNGYVRRHTYDGLSRPETVTTTALAGESFTIRHQYDALGRQERLHYPTGFAVRQVYNERGYLAELRNVADNSLLWRSERVSAEGQMQRQLLGNGVATTRDYDPAHGWVREIRSGLGVGTEVQNLSFNFDPFGNLTSRSDNTRGLLEEFLYDPLNRLTLAQIPGRTTKVYQYDAIGNIAFKSDVGAYTYDRIGAGPHAVTKAGGMMGRYSYDPNGNMTGGNGRSFSYFSFNKPGSIVGAGARSDFTYDAEHNRLTHTATVGGDTTTTLYIGGLYERATGPSGTKHRHFVLAGNSLVAIHTTETGAARTRYVHKDHLGSIESLTDESGHVVERFAYDPHGKRRGENWEDIPSGTRTSSITELGFGGHVQLDALELVHMGGRVYDPVLGRFTSADPFVQSLEDTQALNRYSYALNNPLSFTDPSGFIFKKIAKLFKKAVNAIKRNVRQIAAIAVAAAISWAGGWSPPAVALAGFVSGLISSKGDIRTALISAGTALAFNWVGGIKNPFLQVAAHGTVGGVSAEIQGGSFVRGFLTAAITKSLAQPIDYVTDLAGIGGIAGRTIASATVGGITADLTGGRFSDGAVTGAFSRLFNDEDPDHESNQRDPDAIEPFYGFEEAAALVIAAPVRAVTWTLGRATAFFGERFGLTGAKTALQTTAHGAERIAGAAATRGGVLNEAGIAAVRQGGRVMTQADGATVRILQTEAGRFNIVVEGNRGIVTTFENISQKSLDRLGRNYGWQ